MRKWIDVPHSINQSEPNVTLGAATAAGSGDGATEAILATFLCPVGQTIVVQPTSTFAAYLSDNEAVPAELADGSPVRVAHVDSAGDFKLDRINATYATMKDFADQNKMKRLQKKFSISEKEKLIFYVIPASGKSLKPASCRFDMQVRRVSKLLSV